MTTYGVPCEDSDESARLRMLIFAGRTSCKKCYALAHMLQDPLDFVNE